jgi:hypothetical protein
MQSTTHPSYSQPQSGVAPAPASSSSRVPVSSFLQLAKKWSGSGGSK